MKILIVGASGTLGQAVAAELGARHDIVRAGRSSGDVRVDMRDAASVAAMYRDVGELDAVVCTAGKVPFAPLADLSEAKYLEGLQDKLLGQVRLALIGQHHLNEGGSITLTGGIVADEPIRGGSNATTVNAALQGFVRAAACELRGGRRINVVSPTVLTESAAQYGAFFPGFESVSAARAALAYRRSVAGIQSGRTYRVG